MEINKKILGERIAQCRKKADMTQNDLAILLNVQRQVISYYEKGSRTPNIDDLATMAQLFNTTTDYLLGLTDVESTDMKIKAICDYTGLNEASVKHLHSSLEPLLIHSDEDFLDDKAKQALEFMTHRAKLRIAKNFKFINYFLSSSNFYDAVSLVYDYFESVRYSSDSIEKTLEMVTNKSISSDKVINELKTVVLDTDRIFYFEAIENINNIVNLYCKEITDRYKKSVDKILYLRSSTFPAVVYPEENNIKFGDMSNFDLKTLTDTEINELNKIRDVLIKRCLEIRAGKGVRNANDNETE